MECITSLSYKVIVNNEQLEHFKPNRGIRQGDPISSYILIICANVLSIMLYLAQQQKQLQGVNVN